MDEERKLNKLGKHNDGRSKLPAGRYYGKGKAKR